MSHSNFYKDILHFGGFAATGGSALRDFFYEYEEIFLFPAEFRLLKEKDGILDLENSIFNSMSPDNIDLSIKDFIILCKNLGRINNKFNRRGFNYDYFTDGQFSILIDEFIKEITDYIYFQNTHNLDFRKNYFSSQYERYAKKFLPYALFEQKSYMSYPSHEKFEGAVKKLLRAIFENACKKERKECKVIALHNSINHFNHFSIKNSRKYFDNFKMILVDRDPRDIFLDLPQNKYLPKNNDQYSRAKCFVKFFLKLRINLTKIKEYENCLFINFEDLILNTQKIKTQIDKFLNLEKDNELKNKFFLPERSIKNIKKYKKTDQKYYVAIKYIEDNLTDYLYKFKS